MTSTQTGSGTVHAVLIPGFWLGGWAWDDVVPVLERSGLVAHPVTLPGLAPDDDRSTVTLAQQVDAVVELIGSLDGEVVVVGHSGGALVAESVVDRLPERVSRVVYVDDGPLVDGFVVMEEPPHDVVEIPFPDDEQLAEDDLSTEGITPEALAELRTRTVPEPIGVMTSPVRLTDERRLAVPATVICTSLPSPVLRDLVSGGQMPTELGAIASVEYVDLPTGHWPMFSRPVELGEAIATAAAAR